ncbi:hypothetical protein HK097_002030, partial [Rhizophlyctis rosea]
MQIRKYCPLITCYVDENDGALFWAELALRAKVVGRNPGKLYTVLPLEDDNHHRDSSDT